MVMLLMLSGFAHSLRSQNLSTTITFEERVHNFGTILESMGKVSHAFIFHNNGKTPVVINEIYSGCGCIGRVLSKKPVKPGGKGVVTILFNPSYKSGFFSKEIVVFSNNGQEYNRIWVEGNITPAGHPVEDDYPYNFGSGLYLRLKVMALGYCKPGETKQITLHYANETNKPMTLRFVGGKNKGLLAFDNPGTVMPKGRGAVTFSYTMPATGNDDMIIPVYLYVNGKKLASSLEFKALNWNNIPRGGPAPQKH